MRIKAFKTAHHIGRPPNIMVGETLVLTLWFPLQMSYWKQYSSGMLNRQAARTLINTVENVTDHKGR